VGRLLINMLFYSHVPFPVFRAALLLSPVDLAPLVVKP